MVSPVSTKMLRMSEADRAWVGGLISVFGTFRLSKHNHPEVELLVKSVKHPGAIAVLSMKIGIKVKHKKSGDEVPINGEELALLWTIISNYTTNARDIEYNAMREAARKLGEEYDKKIAYQKERASDPRSTHDQIRRHAEAVYKNDDPAVQVLEEGFLTSDMAVAYDLDRARIEREKDNATSH